MDVPEPLSHCYAHTLRIETRMGTCSSFVMNHKAHQWLVTARHVVQDGIGNDKPLKPFEVLDQYGEKHSGLERLEMTNPVADVTVFRLWAEDVDFGPPLEPYGADDVRPTQDVSFLGFPDLGNPAFYGLGYASMTTPFIKQATVSGQAEHRGINVWLLNGMANHGFSGGPVIICEQESEDLSMI
jgi:hypothetical protein